MNWLVVLPIVLALVALRFVGASLLLWVVAWWAGLYLFFAYGFATPIPSSAVQMYMAIATLALVAYVSSSGSRWRAVADPVHRTIVEPGRTPLLAAVALAIPAVVAWNVWQAGQVRAEAPFYARTVHPAPPAEIEVHGQPFSMIHGDNPLRRLEKTDPERFARHVANGRTIYYRNCFYCHGDGLAGDGPFAHGLNPIPTNFDDSNVLPNFTESYFFWRIAKGGPGLPDEGAPGDSAMPRWEDFLEAEEMWELLLFLYDFTGYRPRAHAEEIQD